MVNKCTFIGNLGKDPESRSVSGGIKVVNFSIATTKKWNDRDKGPQEKTEWIPITCWRGLAEIVEKYCKKGMSVYVEGEFQTQSWDGDDGKKHYKSFINASEVKFLSKAKDVAGSGGARPSQGGGPPPGGDDDLPF